MPRKLKAHEAAEYYGTSISNLRKWAREGRIDVEETPGGHYLYIIPNEEDPITKPDISKWNPYILYSRVSSRKQRDDLGRQSRFLKTKYPEYSLIEDIGSGINNKRHGFRTILEQLFKGNVKKVVVAYPDRFSRLGYDFFEWLFTQFGAVLESVEKPDSDTGDELVGDIMEIFTVFTSRYYGKRKYDNLQEDKDTSNKKTETTLSKM